MFDRQGSYRAGDDDELNNFRHCGTWINEWVRGINVNVEDEREGYEEVNGCQCCGCQNCTDCSSSSHSSFGLSRTDREGESDGIGRGGGTGPILGEGWISFIENSQEIAQDLGDVQTDEEEDSSTVEGGLEEVQVDAGVKESSNCPHWESC